MLLGSRAQQPIEVLPVDFSYAAYIAARGGTATAISAVVIVPAGMTLADSVLSGQVFQFFPTGGTDMTSYRWNVTVDITIGGHLHRLQDEYDIVVTNI